MTGCIKSQYKINKDLSGILLYRIVTVQTIRPLFYVHIFLVTKANILLALEF